MLAKAIMETTDTQQSVSASPNDIRICDKCKHMRVKSMLPKP